MPQLFLCIECYLDFFMPLLFLSKSDTCNTVRSYLDEQFLGQYVVFISLSLHRVCSIWVIVMYISRSLRKWRFLSLLAGDVSSSYEDMAEYLALLSRSLSENEDENFLFNSFRLPRNPPRWCTWFLFPMYCLVRPSELSLLDADACGFWRDDTNLICTDLFLCRGALLIAFLVMFYLKWLLCYSYEPCFQQEGLWA